MGSKIQKYKQSKIGYLLLVMPLLLLSVDVNAQFPGSNRGNSGGFGSLGRSSGGGASMNTPRDESRDTLSQEVYYYYADNAEVKKLFQDSSMLNFHIYDPVRQAEYEHVHLGNLGSAHRQIVFQQRFHKGFDAGYHNFDLYLTKPKNIRYYQLEKDYSDIYFSQTNQEKTSFNADFSKPISRNLYLNLLYRNIRNEGQYTHQGSRANALTGSLSYTAKNQKYRGYFSITTNTIEQNENGGGQINEPTFAKKTFDGDDILPPGRPVNTNSGAARYYERDLNYTQFYLLQKTPKIKTTPSDGLDSLRTAITNAPPKSIDPNKKDTLAKAPPVKKEEPKAAPPAKTKTRTIPTNKNPQRPPIRENRRSTSAPQIPPTGRKFTLMHNLRFKKNTYKYVDVSNLEYYGDFLTDDRGLRNFIETNQIENSFSIRTFRLAKDNKIDYFSKKKNNPTQKDLIEVGATHTYTKLYQEPLEDRINNVFLFGKMSFTPTERLKINAYGHYGGTIGGQFEDYYLKGDFLWDTKKLGRLDLSFLTQSYTPSLLKRQFLVTQQEVWNNNEVFKNGKETSFSARYTIPKLKIDLTGNFHLIDNYIYYDVDARPRQHDKGISVLQLIVKNKVDVWRFHLENTVYFQKGGNNDKATGFIRFPNIYSMHRLYLDLNLFKVMKTHVGGEVRLNTAYYADNYQPLTAQFFIQNTEAQPLYPIIDVFLNFRINQFRFFLVYENLYHFATPNNKFHFNTYTYPIFDPQMRLGFRWLFLD